MRLMSGDSVELHNHYSLLFIFYSLSAAVRDRRRVAAPLFALTLVALALILRYSAFVSTVENYYKRPNN